MFDDLTDTICDPPSTHKAVADAVAKLHGLAQGANAAADWLVDNGLPPYVEPLYPHHVCIPVSRSEFPEWRQKLIAGAADESLRESNNGTTAGVDRDFGGVVISVFHDVRSEQKAPAA